MSSRSLHAVTPARSTLPASRFGFAVTATMPVVLLVGVMLADALQPRSYSPIRQTISVAAGRAGNDRWVGTAALLAIGVGFVLCAAVLPVSRWWGRPGMLATGICGLGVALCPESATGPTASHELFSVAGAVLLAVGPLFTARSGGTASPVQRVPVALTACLLFLALTANLVYQLNAGDASGLAERVAVLLETSWPLAVVLSARLPPNDVTDAS